MPDLFRPTDAAARAQASSLIDSATYAALAVTDPDNGRPSISRIALATDQRGMPLSLISSLAPHTAALEANPACALLIGEPGDKGDPLTHPRLTLHATARIIARETLDHAELLARYLSLRPKAALYADFVDFRFVLFAPEDALLNGGFGKAFRLTAADLDHRG
ncbi:HugZ family protein [Lutimaribacter marinistellae]|uniref:HugZ family protein n=1 Tax=Lutimaribacter marinistellae TaxID=1820329 RepID=A0ABV7TAU9_9RHOB